MMVKINFLPGPVEIMPKVRMAFAEESISHRGSRFMQLYTETAQRLLQLGKSKYVALLMGSGTMANVVIGQQLKSLPGIGLILSNGEFGDRLIAQSKKSGLDFEVYSTAWGEGFEPEVLQRHLGGKSWLWMAQCETSTGAINLNEHIIAACKDAGVKLCLDSTSSLGNQEVDFSQVYLAGSTAGKGLGAYSGLSMVFYNHEPLPLAGCHDYMDLAAYHKSVVPFTLSSNLLNALHAALSTIDYQGKFVNNAKHAERIRKWMNENAIATPLSTAQQADYVWTLALGSICNAVALGDFLQEHGISAYYSSSYLIRNNWLQLTLMGYYTSEQLERTLCILADGLAACRKY